MLNRLFPPLHIFVVSARRELILYLPLVNKAREPIYPNRASVRQLIRQFVSNPFPARVDRPVLTFVHLRNVTSSPLRVQRYERAAALITVPRSIAVERSASRYAPFRRVVAFNCPYLMSAPIRSTLAVVGRMNRVPLVPFTRRNEAICFVLIINEDCDRPVFVEDLNFLVGLLRTQLQGFALNMYSR